MKIITNENECNKIIQNHRNSIFDSYGYKKILNSHYDPDTYLFFVDGEDVIPLVVKNNLVTFFGGVQHNHAHTLPNNGLLLNNMLSYLKKENYRFHLISINKDYFDLLEESNQYFDVPYPAEWHYIQVSHYNIMNILESYSSRKNRESLKRIMRKKQNYTFVTLTFTEFKAQFGAIIKKHINYFSERGKETVWEGNENLLFELLAYFNEKENLLIRLIKLEQDMVGISIPVYNNEEMIYYFASSFKKEDHYISQIMYLDMLEIARELSTETKITEVNSMRGAFSIKKRLGFTPTPLYALVKDNDWIVQADSDIDPKSYGNVYGRSSWG